MYAFFDLDSEVIDANDQMVHAKNAQNLDKQNI